MEVIDFILRMFGAVKEYEDADEAERRKSQRTFVIAVIAVVAAIILTLVLYPMLNR